jgi:glyoxylase-like metal-dependent hydrolase (beta-lactamase superfamily II)
MTRFLLPALLLTSVALAPAAPAAPASSPDASAGIALQGADSYHLRIGDIEVIALSDGSVPQDLHVLLRDTTAAHTDALLDRGFLKNPVEASINAFLFRTGNRVVLVDTGAGDFFGPGFGGKLLDSLSREGVSPDQITDVLLTHAHDDHMGGLVHNGKLNFPNATVHLGKPDLDFFLDRTNAARTHYAMSYFDQAATALQPEVDAGKIRPFSATTEVVPGVVATLHPGHTPGSAFYTLTSRGQSLTFVGDIIHVAAVQAPDTGVTIAYDVDTAKAAAVRREAFARFAAERTLIAIPHLSFPGIGHMQQVGSGFAWVPIPYTNRAPASDAAFADPHKNGDQP